MKKGLKITLIILGVLVGIVALDTLQAKVFDNSPLLKIRDNFDGGTLDYIDKGIFVDHYHCNNNEDVTTWKGTKFACSAKEGKKEIEEIVDLVARDNLSCDEALEKFYQDENYTYSYSCIKSDNVIVKYNDGSEETVKDALQNNRITIQDLDKFNISYIKEEIENNKEFDFYLTKPEIHNDIRFNDYFTFENRKIYLSGNINQFYVVDGSTMILKEFISNYNGSLDDSIKMITDKLDKVETYRDGGTTVYKSKYKDITLISCKKIDGNNNIFIGDYSLEYTDDLCE